MKVSRNRWAWNNGCVSGRGWLPRENPDKNKIDDFRRHASASGCTNAAETDRCASRFTVWSVEQDKRILLGVGPALGPTQAPIQWVSRTLCPGGWGRLRGMKLTNFDVLLTVHLSIFILVINQLDVQNLFYNKFISCLCMFRAPCTHRQEVKIVLYSLW